MKVAIAGGGTAGHVYPAIALARILAQGGDSLKFIGTAEGIEARLVREAGFEFLPIEVVGRGRGLSRKNLVAAAKLVAATGRALRMLAHLDPDVIVGTGGYVSLPVILAGWLHRVPLVLHEQNAVPGLANRVGGRLARSVGVSFRGTEGAFRGKARFTGNPVRPEIAGLEPGTARAEGVGAFGLEAGRRTLLVAGGSQGAVAVNEAALGCYERWRDLPGLQVLHLVGPGNLEASERHLAGVRRPSDQLIWRLTGYTDRMDLAYAVADLALCRSGATTVAELAAVGLPAILIPYPHALDDDQQRNAEAVEASGGAEVVANDDLDPERLSSQIEVLLFDQDRLAAMSKAVSAHWVPDAPQRLADLVREAAGVGHRRLGLDPAWTRFHLVGAGGAGMSAIAHLLTQAGFEVSGSDRSESATLESLRRLGLTVWVGHDRGRLSGVDAVMASSAVPQDNVEVTEAREAGIPVLSRGEAVARIFEGKRTIAVAGTHGKTTTSAMVATILETAGTDPTYIVGGPIAERGPGGRFGGGSLAVVEADEAFGSFLLLKPAVALVTNIDADHLDYYGGMEKLEDAFKTFLESAGERVVVCRDDERAFSVASGFDPFTYGFSEGSEVSASEMGWDAASARFKLTLEGRSLGEVGLGVGGRQNVQNALAAAACGLAAGVAEDAVVEGLRGFRGVGRRFEHRGTLNGADLVDDYAHHPTEISAALDLAGAGRWSRVVAVFQPHLYSRTRALHRELGEALTAADLIVVTDVDGAREDPVPGITGKMVVDAACEASPGRRVVYLPRLEEAAEFVGEEARRGDVVITLGCGYVTKFHDMIPRS